MLSRTSIKNGKGFKSFKVTATKFWMLNATVTSAGFAKQITTRNDSTKSYLANKKVVLYPTVMSSNN